MTPSSPIFSTRHGISIIEVLTAIVVAMIGVFGVMVMIPFAIKQAETGLDRDAATALARNAIEQFEISGYRSTGNWVVQEQPTLAAADPTVPTVFSIDPLAITENGTPGNGDYANTTFPYNADIINGATPFPANLVIQSVNLGTPVGQAMSIANARRLFRGSDDLSFGEALETTVGSGDEDLNGPQQLFDSGVDSTGAVITLRRQSRGELSWSSIVVPVKDDFASDGTSAWKYRMYVLVYKDRSTDVTDATNAMLTAQLDPTANVGLASPLGTVYLETAVADVESGLRKDDWVMLINRALNRTDDTPPGGLSVNDLAEKGFDRQIAFCRVVNFSNPSGSLPASITLDGPDFNFGDPTDANSIIRETHIVHLKDVIAVYERTIVPERESNWNISF